jgi:hypothetical protein
MVVDPWELAAITPIDVPDYAKQRRSSDDELKAMQQRLLRAVSQSIEDRKPKPNLKLNLKAEQYPQMRNVANTNISYDTRTGVMSRRSPLTQPDVSQAFEVTPAEEVSAEELKSLIYRLRDEWCAEAGEWDGSKMPVPVLAEKLAEKIRAYKRPSWEK